MKNNKGLTIIELLIVISIIAILSIAFGFSFQGWMGSYRIENQVKEMYADFMNARVKAMNRNRAHFVVITATTYQIFEDTNENETFDSGVDTALMTFANPKTIEFPVEASSWTGTETINARGLIAPSNTIRFDIGNNNPDYDCLLLLPTRINIGRWNGTCIER